MFQPFEQFRTIYVDKLIGLKKRYLVSQSYKRAFNHFAQEHKIDILLTDYDNPGAANIHLNAVKHDKYAAVLNLENQKHKQKLLEMLAPTSNYNLFWSVVKSSKELQQRINAKYKENMRRYIEKNTNWRIGRDTTLYPSVEVTFGELFIILKYSSQTLRIKFEEIEKYKLCVTT
jgi:hypothetical protein